MILGHFSPVGVGVIFLMSTLLCAALLCSLALVIWLGFDDWLIGLLWGWNAVGWLAGVRWKYWAFFPTLHFFILRLACILGSAVRLACRVYITPFISFVLYLFQ